MPPLLKSLGRAFAVPVGTFLLSISVCFGQSSQGAGTDLILVNGKIITVDAHDSIAQAIAIHNGRITAVGGNDEIRKGAPKDALVIDLHGRTATPGLIDTHCHFGEAAALYGVELSTVTKIKEAVELVRQKVATRQPGEWITGSGWDEGKLADHRYIYAADLDQVAPDNPVWLMHTTGHYGVANSYALRLAKISGDSKDPLAGTIDRDSSGRPTGVLKERAMDAVTALIPPFTKEQERNGVLKMMADFNAEGMTAAKDPGIEPDRWDLYRKFCTTKNPRSASSHCFTAAAPSIPPAPRSPISNRSPGLRNRWATACCSPAESSFSWMAAGAGAPPGFTIPGTKTERNSTAPTPATPTSIRRCFTK